MSSTWGYWRPCAEQGSQLRRQNIGATIRPITDLKLMPTTGQQRHQMIERALLRQPDAQADVSVLLWETLAAELGVIIGERGFESLYARSLHRASKAFPWLAHSPQKTAGEAFRLLAVSLGEHDPAEARAASAAFLNIFTDTLILLIGELLTNNLLRKAWGDDVLNDAETEHRS